MNNEINPDIAYNEFMEIFPAAYDTSVSEIEIKIKTKSLSNPRLTKGVKKTSKK